jgi:uncharacterized protein (DUF433 family)
MNAHTNPLARGFYTVRDAARLIEVGNAQRIRGWLGGYPRRRAGPLLIRDYAPVGKTQELSFLDLMEVRFVEHFRSIGVKPQTLRRCLETARAKFKEDKPLLKQGVLFIPTDDRRKVVVEEVLKPVAEENSDKALWNLVDRNYEFNQFIERHLARGLTFDPKTELTATWAPRPKEFPDIIIDPAVAYGQPVIPKQIPTATLFEAWEAENGDAATVADWFNIPTSQVQMAVGFEQLLKREEHALAA